MPYSSVTGAKLVVERSSAQRTDVSVIIPIFEEEDNIAPLCEQLFAVLDGLPLRYEVIAVNDGSRDASLERLIAASAVHPNLRIVNFSRNYGQTAAIMAGLDHAVGEIIISIDSDLQNDPLDIPALLERLDAGYDVVSGWRKDRQDAPVRRNFVSRVANRLISRISGVHLNDYGCTLKAYRRRVVGGFRLYGEMHRFIPSMPLGWVPRSPRFRCGTIRVVATSRNTAWSGSRR